MKLLPQRLRRLLEYIAPCHTFADVGCDHGYIASEVLSRGLAEYVVISDISQKSLQKAVDLLQPHNGKFCAVCCDGLSGFNRVCDQVMIAGMGGEEICKILLSSPFLPQRLVLQPMKNAEKVRALVIEKGFEIVRDDMFFDGQKYYFALSAVVGKNAQPYTAKEVEYGRDNLRGNKDFLDFLLQKIQTLKTRDTAQSGQIEQKIKRMEIIANEVRANLRNT